MLRGEREKVLEERGLTVERDSVRILHHGLAVLPCEMTYLTLDRDIWPYPSQTPPHQYQTTLSEKCVSVTLTFTRSLSAGGEQKSTVS